MEQEARTGKPFFKRFWWLFVILTILVLGGGGYTAWRYLLGHNGLFTTKPQTVNVGAEIEKEGKSVLIASAGGTLEHQGKSGEKIVLSLPKQSLLSSQTVTIRNINSMDLPNSQMKFIAGVELTPDGTRLANAGELSIGLPEGTETKGLVGFSFGTEGKDFFLYPAQIKDNTATFKLSGFSGYGLINLGGYTPQTQPSETSKQAKQYISNIVAVSSSDQFWGRGDLDEKRLKQIENILRGWYKTEVKTKLEHAQNNEKIIDQAGFEFFNWLGVVQLFGMENRFGTDIQTAKNMLASAVKKGAETSGKKCVSEKDPNQVSFMLHLFAFATMADIDGRSGLDADEIKEKARKCAQFELRINSTFESQCDSCDSPDIGKYSGVIPLTLDEGFNLSGEGIVRTDSYRENVGTQFEHGCTPQPDFPVTVFNTQVKAIGDKPNVSLIFNLRNPGDIHYDCSFYIGETLMKISGSLGSDYDLDFGDLHEDEQIKFSEEDWVFLLPDWEIVGSGGVFARKSYQRSKHQVGLAGIGGTDKEDTVFELVHKPLQ